MMENSLNIREIQAQDIAHIVAYWNTVSDEHLKLMGVPKEAYLHLHVWTSNSRQKGLGSQMAQRAIPISSKI